MSSCDFCKFSGWCFSKAEDMTWCFNKPLLNNAYEQGRADQKKEDNEFFNLESGYEMEKQKIRADAIDEYKERILKDLILLKDMYFDIAKGTKMPERYTHLKRMDTVDVIIEMVKIKAEQLKENNK